MRTPNYDKFPATHLSGFILDGWVSISNKLAELLQSDCDVIAIDSYVGVHESEIIREVEKLNPALLIDTRSIFKSEAEILALTDRFVTDDTLFGYVTPYFLPDYIDEAKKEEAIATIAAAKGKVIIVGSGAALIAPANACIIYADLARWEHQLRMRKSSVKALGLDNSQEPFTAQHKRCYFNDWLVCDAYKDTLYDRVDFWLDTHIENEPKLIDKETFHNAMSATVAKPFRVVPYFAAAPWGGQWMREVFDLDKSEINYGWAFDCVPEENSLFLNVDGVRFEMPSLNVVLLKSKELLGGPVESRFGREFPIRFDFLDTVEGGYLSFQVHPTTEFIKENFGMPYTQDESYYMVAAKENATVYLGLKDGVDKEAMSEDLRRAERGEIEFDAEKYSNKIIAKKHDHFLIPAGTVHCSGPEGVVLEISSTPNHFTFKMWDWGRLGLDGKPRPINVERGLKVIDWERDTTYTMKNLVNAVTNVGEGEGWVEEQTGLHINEFIETRRHRFTAQTTHSTNQSVNVINLVEGEEVIVESPTNAFESFIVHFAETFIVPAHLGDYTITPHGLSVRQECVTLKAYVRF